jgi:hypothetical protein
MNPIYDDYKTKRQKRQPVINRTLSGAQHPAMSSRIFEGCYVLIDGFLVVLEKY